MQLTFLGVRYKANLFSIPVVESQIIGKYRGQFFGVKTKSVQEKPMPQSFLRLKYRGVDYLRPVYSHTNSRTGSAQLGLEEFEDVKGFLESEKKK